MAEAETGDPVAVCQFNSSASPPHLDLLFVEPTYIGQGVGSLLFDTLTENARDRGINKFNLDADPNAAAFYMAKGGRVIGERGPGSYEVSSYRSSNLFSKWISNSRLQALAKSRGKGY